MNDELKGFSLLLASRSPRRKQLLEELGLEFRVVIRDWDEAYPSGLEGKEIALYIAERKAEGFLPEIKRNEIVITADTIVWCDGRVLDKPASRDDAIRILRLISGNTHEVITGVCLLSDRCRSTFSSSTKVTFMDLTDEEIIYYVDSDKPYDKAGAYGIQEWIGIAACSRIEGSYFNVMGLPSDLLYMELKKMIVKITEHKQQ
ncbi:MAG: Maf family nucleotide pyrophosphatase [Bacteroidales bacterium]|nr:Maf family nucleotide pyrophosphatase [Bacteroidales bacterium]